MKLWENRYLASFCDLGPSLLAFFVFILLPPPAPAQYYVSSAGSDANPGTLQGPFRTIQKAADLMIAGDTCYIMSGTYREQVVPANHGEPGNPIVFINHDGGRVVILGSDSLAGWSPYKGGIYKTHAPVTVTQLFVNGRRAFPARYPDHDNGDIYSTSDWNPVTADSLGNAVFTGMDKPNDYWAGAYCKILTGHKWVSHIGKISGSNNDTVRCDERSSPWNDYNPGVYLGEGLGYIHKHLHALDKTNEWHWQNDTLYYFPEDGTVPETLQVEARTRLFGFNCDERSYIKIVNIHFVWSSVNFREAVGCELNGGSVWFPTPFFYYENSWTRNEGGGSNHTIDHWDGKGIWISGSDNIIRNCYVAHSWGDGISVGGSNNRVVNCLVEDCDWSATDCAAISVTGYGHAITGNTLRNTARSILVHRYSDSTNIRYNHLHDCGLMCDDLGLTYSYETDGGGSEIAYNWVHDNHASGTASGIYLDNNDSNYVVHHNVVWKCAYAIQTNKPAINHKIINNTVWDCANAQWAWGPEGTTIVNQTVMNNLSDKPWNVGTYFQTNLSTNDPLFVDPANGDFRLQEGSPAIDHGTAVPGITDGFVGDAPDAGAYEFGGEDWTAGSDVGIPDLSDVVIIPERATAPDTPSFRPRKMKVFLFAGQSNMDGRANGAQLSEDDRQRLINVADRIRFHYNHQPVTPLQLTTPSNYIQNKFDLTECFGPELFFGIELAETSPDEEFIFIKRSKGGTSLYGCWNPDWSKEKAKQMNELDQPRLHQDLMGYVDSVVSHYGPANCEIAGMFWVQGEKDSGVKKWGKEPAESYGQNLRNLIDRTRTDLDVPQMPFIMFQVGSGKVVEGMKQVSLQDENVFLIPQSGDTSSADYYEKNPPPIGHYTAESMKRIGVEFFKVYEQIQLPTGE